ncbi:MAG TPA: radical SAM protein, partial [Spirochaetia bacterium]|nr:radical SAM protein [Spirochaetia bacterium]
MNHGEFFDNQRDRMVRKGDWTRAAELNLLAPEAWNRPLKVLVTRLSTYEDTSLSLTHHYLYALVSALGYYPDRAFLPPGRDEELWREFGVPWLVGLQSRRSGEEFDLVAFSNAVTQEMGNLLWFLKNSGFPVAARDRVDREDLPLVILGGANAPYSSLLWGLDSPVDAVFAGEDRSAMEALFRTVAEGKERGWPKALVVEALGKIPGVLVPGRPEPVVLRPSRSVLDPALLAAMPVALGEGNAGKAVLAISAGCAGFCSFCAESWTRRPYAEEPAETLVEAALAVKAGQGAGRLDLFSFNFNMHAQLYPFLEAIVPWFSAVGLKSQRFDSLAADPLLLDLEKLFGKTWFTCGLEGISDRLRRALNKNLDADQVRRAFAAFARVGVRELKAFLIATGWETEADYEEFGRLLASIRTLPGPRGQPLKVVFSVTPLVHFPHTPLEFEPIPDPREVDRAARRILRVAKEAGFEGRIAAGADEAAVCDLMLRPPSAEFYATWSQTVLEDGFVYRDEVPTWFHRHWKARWEASGWTEARLAGAYGVQANRSAPWARLDAGVRRSFLEAQYGRNLSFQELEPAGLVREKSADQNLVRRWT